MAEIEVRGLAELERALSRFPQELQRRELAKAWRKAGKIMRDDARDRAPVRQVTDSGFGRSRKGRVRTPGFLASQMKLIVNTINGIPTALIGWSKAAFYGSFLEYGTSKIAARPFMRPAFDTTVQPVIREFAFQLRLGIERTAKIFYNKGP